MSADEETSSSGSPVVIGLSFGNAYSSIAFTSPSDGTAAVIANEEGDRQIPSILSYVSGEEFHGTQAKAQIIRNPRNTVAFFRDYLGKGFKDIDATPCHASAHPVEKNGVSFEVQEGEGDAKSTLSVSEVATRHLKRLKESASDYLGRQVTAAVVTVPSDFDDAQKSALSESAAAAGIDILQFISEPISALLAHDAKLQAAGEANAQDKIIVVADLGSSRSDVTVVASRGGIYTTLATVHDYELGGKNLDEVLAEYAAKEYLKKNKSAADPRKDERGLAKLNLEAEAVKKALSIGASAQFAIESLTDGIDFNLSVNRTRFDLLGNKVFGSIVRLLESAVAKANLDLLDVDEVLLSGGSSHVPKIAASVQSAFPETTTVIAPSTSPSAINPSELAVRGAAMQASLIAEFEKEHIAASTEAVVTVTPQLTQAIGLALEGGEGGSSFAVIVEPHTPVPVRRTAQLSVPAGGDVLLRVAEGKREIKVTQQAPAPKDEDDDDDDDEDDEDDEPEEVREKVWKTGNVLAELAIRDVKAKGKVEVQINVAADLAITIVAREVGGKGGVRGVVEGKA